MKLVNQLTILGLLSTVPFVTLAQEEKDDTNIETMKVVATIKDNNDQRIKKSSTATKMPFDIKDIPQTINSVNLEQEKIYGKNDLSVIVNKIPGVDAIYDMRDEGIKIRGFSASSGDIYRDGVRASGQVRQSTANIERIEILKGPASVLYGRGSGGGIINMISKQANFDSPTTLSLRSGSWDKYGGMLDINHILHHKLAMRMTIDHQSNRSFRRGIKQRDTMISPSILYDNLDGFNWLVQYTHDNLWRRPDRAPAYYELPKGVSLKTAYAHPDDYVKDNFKSLRSVMGFEFNYDWSIKLTNLYRKASQNFDHIYGGSYCDLNGKLSNGKACNYQGKLQFRRAWQETANITYSNTIDLMGKFNTASIAHDMLVGIEYNIEKRQPRLALTSAYPELIDPFHPHWHTKKPHYNKLNTKTNHKATSQGLYWQDLISFTNQWKMLTGLRYDNYKFASNDKLKHQHRSYDGHSLSPRIGLIWQPIESQSIYTSYSKNFSPYGGRGLITLSTDSKTVYDNKPQYSRQYEVGIKSDWLNDKFSSQIAVYDLELYNVRYQPDSVNDPYNWQVRGSDRSQGIELSVIGELMPKWYINSGIGYQQAKVHKDKKVPANKGKYLPNTAKNSGYLSVRYLPYENWFTELEINYKGSMYSDDKNQHKRSGYAVWNSAVGYQAKSYDITLSLTNLLGKEYWRSNSMPGTPRAFLLTASYKL
ncbi:MULTISPECIES: TonB-dependent siderophore receptor [unclassified Gilliamella]|uniref:TonB-dependent receptor n=1 Tax=unclassified Gilliamella TaxID=2685620 RepID=UPI00130849C7|nr:MULTISPECIES: TonB-dependent siderophore receptor [unclassified Gilliamella]MWP48469.1 TonB-dependent siderophore receptor [Gilliamella sp. Lep-s35]MWP68252.1 TonB-dependent siderophore receptor [Gilliamella sp. Lep-s5]MWP76609.1 TonB-dependent siderophore receptor [Gilliamella sp. Lep-s21]